MAGEVKLSPLLVTMPPLSSPPMTIQIEPSGALSSSDALSSSGALGSSLSWWWKKSATLWKAPSTACSADVNAPPTACAARFAASATGAATGPLTDSSTSTSLPFALDSVNAVQAFSRRLTKLSFFSSAGASSSTGLVSEADAISDCELLGNCSGVRNLGAFDIPERDNIPGRAASSVTVTCPEPAGSASGSTPAAAAGCSGSSLGDSF
mmetsp:Transcript_89014/g.153960  ORF Transcript_89014/g.153960 Transcript_89014/m.153960 type:complete len:209 (-) Transcript_89014:161-787(-)